MTLLTISFDSDFFPLMVVVGIAWLIPMLLSLFRLTKIPTVIVEIIAGYFIGKVILEQYPIESIAVLDYFALTGFVFLMFLGGLEINVDQIIASMPRKRLTYPRFIRNPLLVGFSYFIITIVISYLAAYGMSYLIDIQNIWYFSLIMVTTSVGIILPILKNRGEINTRFGQMIILAAAIADIFSILLFTITAFVLKNGFQVELIYLFSLIFLFYFFYVIGKRLRSSKVFRKLSYQLSHAASQINIRGTILLILVFVVASQYIDKEVILLGAFLCGLLLSMFLHKDRSILLVKIDGIGYGFFIPIFFVMVGVHFDPSALAALDNSIYLFLSILLLVLFLIKLVPAFLWARLFGRRKALAGGFIMSSRLSLIIAAATIGLELGVISSAVNASFILMAVLTCFISPIIYNLLNPKNVLIGDKTIIVGGTSTGVLLARRLHLHDHAAIIIEPDETRHKDIKSKGITVVKGDGTDREVFEKLKLAPSNHVVVQTGSNEMNLKICEMLRKELQHEKIISKSGTAVIEQSLKSIDVETFDATRILAMSIENLIVRPGTYHTLVESYDNFNVEEIIITNKEVDGKQLKGIPFHGDGTIIMIRRGNNIFVPHGDTYFRLGDVVNVFGSMSALEDFRSKFY